MVLVDDLNKLDGVEIRPGITLLGSPSWHEDAQEWRALAAVNGALAVVVLKITVKGQLYAKDEDTPA